MAFPVLGITWWIYIGQTNPGTHEVMVDQFLAPLPVFLRNARLVTIVQLVFSGAAVVWFIKGLDQGGSKKYVSLLLLCCAALIGLWLVFTLM